MKIFPSHQVREIDQYTIENEPVRSIDLMERAASKLLDWYVRYFKINQKVIVLAGPGNNGGDALALARMLIERHYIVEVYVVAASGKLSADCEVNYIRLQKKLPDALYVISKSEDFPVIKSGDMLIDGIFGSGLSRCVEGLFRELIIFVNSTSAKVVSIDIPSGLFGEDNLENMHDSIIRANYTLTFQFPFLSFLFSENEKYTGIWKVIDIGLSKDKIEHTDASYSLTERREIAALLPPRKKFAHKGDFGHALTIAGSYGMMGAAVLTAKAMFRTGAGLVSAHIPGIGYVILQSSAPEVMVSLDEELTYFSMPPDLSKYNAVSVGPGLGMHLSSMEGLKKLLSSIEVPLVLDADAINMLASNKEIEMIIPEGSILTPHPGEFDRLAGKSSSSWSRHKKQIDYSVRNRVIIVLKGAYTGISFPDGKYIFNFTGNPGMATGGSGDVLTGIIVSLLAQGMAPEEAAITGVYVHGTAGDIVADKVGQEALIAGDIVDNIGEAFKQVKARPLMNEDRGGGIVQ